MTTRSQDVIATFKTPTLHTVKTWGFLWLPLLAFFLSQEGWTQTKGTVSAAGSPYLTSSANIFCPKYKIYYIDLSTQFLTPPVPLEDHAEFIFCSDHTKLDDLRARLRTMKPIRSKADLDGARIKAIPQGKPEEALVFCKNGEITYRGKQYRINRNLFEPALVSFQNEGDRRRAMAAEQEAKELGLPDQVKARRPQPNREPAKAR